MPTSVLLLAALTSPARALSVFILDDSDSNTDNLVAELEGWGHTVTLSTTDYGFSETAFSSSSGVSLTDYDAVIWLSGGGLLGTEMGSSGQADLLSYVDGGGGLVLFGSTGYQYSEYGFYSWIAGLIPLRSTRYTRDRVWTCALPSHKLAETWTLGSTFTPPTGELRDTTASFGVSAFTYDREGTDYQADIAYEEGDGRGVQLTLWGNTTSSSADYETDWTDSDISQLVENALQWVVQRPPEFSLASTWTVAAESSVTLAPDAPPVDPDGGVVTVAWDVGVDGSIDGTANAYVYSAAGKDGPTTETVSLTATDDEGVTTTATTTVDILNVAPVITGPVSTTSVEEGSAASLTVSYVDVEAADTQTVSWDFGDGSTGTGDMVSHTWADNARYTVTATVTDDDGGSTSVSAVQPVTNVAPTLSGTPDAVAYVGVEYDFLPTVTDPGSADTFTFAGTVPAGALIDVSTGALAWTPTADQVGSQLLSLRVHDDDGGTDELGWTVDVQIVDSDGDGMSDAWETTYGLDPYDASDAVLDPDGDGRTNLEEYLGGSDPTVYSGPGQPTLEEPADGGEVATATPELVVGNASAPLGQDLSYGYTVYSDVDLSVPVGSMTGVAQDPSGSTKWTYSGDTLTEDTDYWWTAQAADDHVTGAAASPPFRFFVNTVNSPPTAPGIIDPFDGGIVSTLTPDLVLSAATDPDRDPLHYMMVLGEQDGPELVRVQPLSDDGSGVISWTDNTPLVDGRSYCWFGVAIDDQDYTGPPSDTACFTVDLYNDPPSAPAFVQPQADQVVASTLPTIVVDNGIDPEGRATVHDFELDLSSSFDSASLQSGTVTTDASGQTSWTPTAALAQDTTWFVRARCDDGASTSAWVTESFSIAPAAAAPSVPLLVSPADGTEASAAVSFIVDNAVDPDGDALSYDYVVIDRLGGTVDQAAGWSEDVSGQTSWSVSALPDGVYSWTARAVDTTGLASDWAAPWVFSVTGGVVTGGDTGLGADPLTVIAQGCACSSGGTQAPGRGGLAGLLVVLGLAGLRRRRR